MYVVLQLNFLGEFPECYPQKIAFFMVIRNNKTSIWECLKSEKPDEQTWPGWQQTPEASYMIKQEKQNAANAPQMPQMLPD